MNQITGKNFIANFESRVKNISGNQYFQIQNLSPEVQTIIKKYLINKTKDQWDELGSILEQYDKPPNDQYSPFRKTIFQSNTPENTQIKPIEEALTIVKINPKKTIDRLRQSKRSPPHHRDSMTQKVIETKKKNLPPIMSLINPLKVLKDHKKQNQYEILFENKKNESIESEHQEMTMSNFQQKKSNKFIACASASLKRKPVITLVYPPYPEMQASLFQKEKEKQQEKEKEEEKCNSSEIQNNKQNLSRKFKLKIPKSTVVIAKNKVNQNIEEQLQIFKDAKFPKDPIFQQKYANYRESINLINSLNFLFVQTPAASNFPIYKCYVSRGNNGLLVRQILKQRWWWSSVENKEEIANVNFVWTSLKHQSFLQGLAKVKKQMEESVGSTALNYSSDDLSDQSDTESLKLKMLSEENVKKTLKRQVQVYSDPIQNKCHNHLEFNFHLSNKKALFYNMRNYYNRQKLDVFQYLPLTFHVKGADDKDELLRVQEEFDKKDGKNIWIVKPGEDSNRGNGIKICSSMEEIKEIVQSGETHKNGTLKTYIIQKYIDKPLLYHKRKFDIRCYMLITSINGNQKGFWYQEGYIRTSSKEFSVKNLQNRFIHLTNDAVQKKGDSYGRYEKGNKVSYEEFSKFLQSLNVDFLEIQQKMKAKLFFLFNLKQQFLARDAIRAVYEKIDLNRRENTFELFGLDFMVDETFKVWLIEVNTNPCLETSSPLLFRIIPGLIDNVFRQTLDSLFPPPHFYNPKKLIQESLLEQNKLELIFDENEDGYKFHQQSPQNDDDFGQIIEETEEESSDEQQ